MKVVTAEEMRELDRRAIEDYQIPGLILMENAGIQVVSQIKRHYNQAQTVGILVGKGNNGGDALVVARHLYQKQRQVTLFLTYPGEMFQGDAQTNYLIARNLQLPMVDFSSPDAFAENKKQLLSQDILIDGILGTGIKEGITGHLTAIIEWINQLGKPIVSIDIPSGLPSNLGELIGPCVRADLTISLGLPKLSQLLYPAAQYNGQLEIVDIGLPRLVVTEMKTSAYYLQKKDLEGLISERPADAHKGNFGHLLVVAGSTSMLGAGILACLSSLRMGAGLTTLALPQSLNTAAKASMLEVMTMPLPETQEGSLGIAGLSQIEEFLKRADSLLIGPGLTTNPETAMLVKTLVTNRSVPTVLDADGLNCLAADLSPLKKGSVPLIITPHPGEMAKLMGCRVSDVQRDRIGIVRNFALKHQVYTILKGAKSLIATPEEEVFVNSTGNPGMATGGTGDVLAGMLASLLAQGIAAKKASLLAVYLHGLAGDLAVERLNQISLIAGDIIDSIPAALNTLIA